MVAFHGLVAARQRCRRPAGRRSYWPPHPVRPGCSLCTYCYPATSSKQIIGTIVAVYSDIADFEKCNWLTQFLIRTDQRSEVCMRWVELTLPDSEILKTFFRFKVIAYPGSSFWSYFTSKQRLPNLTYPTIWLSQGQNLMSTFLFFYLGLV